MACDCYLIGIGGTGAKCLESFIHLSAANLTPANVSLGLIDQDESNGNLARCKDTLALYSSLRESLRRQDSNQMEGSNFLSPRLDYPVSPTGNQKELAVWSPLKGVKDMDELFSAQAMSPESTRLYHCLFDKDDRKANLNVGFRGRPYIGAAAFLSSPIKETPLGDMLLSDMPHSINKGRKVKVFLIGSIFGGTGAAGIPIIARKLWMHMRKLEQRDRFELGACMMLPYFQFGSEKEEGIVAAHDGAFLEQTQGALKYYNRLLKAPDFQKTPLFDSLFFLGWNPLISMGYFAEGNQEQQNPSLLPELYAALAATRFFGQDIKGNHIATRPQGEKVTWQDLMSLGNQSNDNLSTREGLGNLVRFAFAYLAAYSPFIQTNEAQNFKNQPWWINRFTKQGIDPTNADTVLSYNTLKDYCEMILKWAGSISYLPVEEDQQRADLFDTPAFAARPTSVDSGQIEILSPDKIKRNSFAGLIKAGLGCDLKTVYQKMCEKNLERSYTQEVTFTGLGNFCGHLYKACEVNT